MNDNDLFVNQKHVPRLGSGYKRYMNHNGMLKEFLLGPLSSKIVDKKLIWFKLEDLPNYLQVSLKDKALTIEEIRLYSDKKERIQEFYDLDGTRIYVTDTTEIMPIVGNFSPHDGICAYTVVVRNNKITLKPILSSPHWLDIFAGNTEYGINVFCLASDLSSKQREDFQDEIIELKDALDFLEQNRRKLN